EREQAAVERIETLRVDVEHLHRRDRNVAGNRAACLDLCIVAYAPQQAIGDARRTARAAGDLVRAIVHARDAEDSCRASYDGREFVRRVELQALHDTETIAQRTRQQARARGRADKRERRQIQLDRTRRRAVADHDVDLAILHRRIEDLL